MKNKILFILIGATIMSGILFAPAVSQAAPLDSNSVNMQLDEDNLVEILQDPTVSELDRYWNNNTDDVTLSPRKGYTNIDISSDSIYTQGISQEAVLEANTTYKMTFTYRINETFSSLYSGINIGFIDVNTGLIANGIQFGIVIPSDGYVSKWDTKSIYINNNQAIDDEFYAGLTFKGIKNMDIALISIQKVN